MSSRYTCVLATSSGDVPNAVPIGYVKVVNDALVLADFYFTKTKANIEANPRVAVSCWDVETFEGYQLKGRAFIDTGPYFKLIEGEFKDKPFKPRSAVVVLAEEVYSLKPGDYGRKLL